MAKFIVCLGDGMADEPLQSLDNKTPLQYAKTPNMDRVAQQGQAGLVHTVPDGLHPGSDVANMGILGYDPRNYYTGRGPIEAAAMDINAPEGMVVFRCNLVCIKDGIMKDFTSGHISTEEANELLTTLNETLLSSVPHAYEFFTGVSYRHIVLLPESLVGLKTTAPHDILDKQAYPFMPKQESDSTGDLKEQSTIDVFIEQAAKILADHPVNKKRVAEGKLPATHIWPWSQGKMPSLPSFKDTFGITGGIVTAVDLLKGLATLTGLEAPSVEGATGFLDTNYENKRQAAFDILEQHDFVYLHVEAPDEAGHMGREDLKVQAIEDFDKQIVGPCLEYAAARDDVYIIVLPDHPTPCHLKTHTNAAVPVAVTGPGVRPDAASAYDEVSVTQGEFNFSNPWSMLSNFFAFSKVNV